MGIVCSYFLFGIAIVMNQILVSRPSKNTNINNMNIVNGIIKSILIILIAMVILIVVRMIIANFYTQLVITAQKYSLQFLTSIVVISCFIGLFFSIVTALGFVKELDSKTSSAIMAFAFGSLLIPWIKHLQEMPILKVEVYKESDDDITWNDSVNITACWHGKNAEKFRFLGFCLPKNLNLIQEHKDDYEKHIIKSPVFSVNETIKPNSYGIEYVSKLASIKPKEETDSLVAIYTDTNSNIFFKSFKVGGDKKMKSNETESKHEKKVNLISMWLLVCSLVLLGCFLIDRCKMKSSNYYSTYFLLFLALIIGIYRYDFKIRSFNRSWFYIAVNASIIAACGNSVINVICQSPFDNKHNFNYSYGLNYLGTIIVLISAAWIGHYLIKWFHIKKIQVCINQIKEFKAFKKISNSNITNPKNLIDLFNKKYSNLISALQSRSFSMNLCFEFVNSELMLLVIIVDLLKYYNEYDKELKIKVCKLAENIKNNKSIKDKIDSDILNSFISLDEIKHTDTEKNNEKSNE